MLCAFLSVGHVRMHSYNASKYVFVSVCVCVRVCVCVIQVIKNCRGDKDCENTDNFEK